jgi:hypothetical protein
MSAVNSAAGAEQAKPAKSSTTTIRTAVFRIMTPSSSRQLKIKTAFLWKPPEKAENHRQGSGGT